MVWTIFCMEKRGRTEKEKHSGKGIAIAFVTVLFFCQVLQKLESGENWKEHAKKIRTVICGFRRAFVIRRNTIYVQRLKDSPRQITLVITRVKQLSRSFVLNKLETIKSFCIQPQSHIKLVNTNSSFIWTINLIANETSTDNFNDTKTK